MIVFVPHEMRISSVKAKRAAYLYYFAARQKNTQRERTTHENVQNGVLITRLKGVGAFVKVRKITITQIIRITDLFLYISARNNDSL